MRLNRTLRLSVKQGNKFPAVILDIHGQRATARLSNNGQILRNLYVTGGPVVIGDQVYVDFGSYLPIIEAPSREILIPEFPEIFEQLPVGSPTELVLATGSLPGYINGAITGVPSFAGFQSEQVGEGCLWKIDEAGTKVWDVIPSTTNGGQIKWIALDPSGFIYAVGNFFVGNKQLYKLNPDSSEVWSIVVAGTLSNFVTHGVAVDQNGLIYVVGGYPSGSPTGAFLKRYTSGGSLDLTINRGGVSGNNNSSVAVDTSGNIYVGGVVISSLTTFKYNSSGSVIWSRNHGGSIGVNDIAVDQNGNVYTVGWPNSGIVTRKYDTDGNLIWSKPWDGGDTVRCLAVDPNGYIVVGGQRGFSAPTFKILQKYDPDGNTVWSIDSHNGVFGAVRQISLDPYGNIYGVVSVGFGVEPYAIKWDSDGNMVWNTSLNVTGANTITWGSAAYPLLGAFPGEW
jgi:hypothetical protein